MTAARKKFDLICLILLVTSGVGDIVLALMRNPIPYFRLALGILLIAVAVQGIRRNRLLLH